MVTGAGGCLSGYYCNAGSSSKTQIECPAGHYCPFASAAPVPCPSGKYNEDKGQRNDDICFDCVLGETSPPGSATCISCEMGKYGKSDGSEGVFCADCPVGTYNEKTGQYSSDACIPCPAGTIGSSLGAISVSICEPCSPGSSSTLGASTGTCSLCDTGKYSAFGGAPACTLCPAGKASTSTGAINDAVCLDCGIGTYGSNDARSCILCLEGTYADSTGSPTCTNCPLGTFNNATGATNAFFCVPCPTGRYSAKEAATSASECIACPDNTYQNKSGASSAVDCLPCNPGFNSSADSTTCCKRGSWAAPADFNCTLCAAGKYGAYPAATNSSVCVDCAPGHYGSANGLSVCRACAAGRFQNSSGMTSCYPCPFDADSPPLTYSSIGSDSCDLLCPNGTSTVTSTSNTSNQLTTFVTGQCDPCPADHFSSWSVSTIVKAIGTERRQLEVLECRKCPVTPTQLFSPKGAAVCCPLGHYAVPWLNSRNAQISCSPCPVNFSCPPQAESPTPCPAGTWSRANSTKCCEMGDYFLGTTCTPCPQGYACPVFSIAPTPCGENTAAVPASAVCCPAGYFSSNRSMTGVSASIRSVACAPCYPGAFCDPPNPLPQLCPIGTYNALSGAASTSISSCLSCPTGETMVSAGASKCCKPGQYLAPQATSCDMCPSGRFSALAKVGTPEDSCTACPPGKYGGTIPGASSLDGARCTICPSGHFCPGDGRQSPCPADTYNPLFNSNSSAACLPCVSGNSNPGEKSCSGGCPSGFYADGNYCTPCVAGRYSTRNTSSVVNCLPCAAGRFSDAASAFCELCPLGAFCSGCVNCATREDASVYNSELCPAGRYSDVKGAIFKDESAASFAVAQNGWFYAPTALNSSCKACPRGTFNPAFGSVSPATCVLCPAGRFSDTPAAGTCTACPAGTFNALLGATSPAQCLPCVRIFASAPFTKAPRLPNLLFAHRNKIQPHAGAGRVQRIHWAVFVHLLVPQWLHGRDGGGVLGGGGLRSVRAGHLQRQPWCCALCKVSRGHLCHKLHGVHQLHTLPSGHLF